MSKNYHFKRNGRLFSFLSDFLLFAFCFIILFSVISISFIPIVDAKTTDKPVKDNPSVEKKEDTPSVEKELKIVTKLKIIEINKSKQENIELTMESDLGNISKDNSISVQTSIKEKTKTTIQQVEFISSSNHNNVKLIVSDLKCKPVEVVKEFNIKDNSKVYKYLDIKLTADEEYIGESGISTMTFTFTV